MPTVPFGGTSSKPASSDEKIAARAFCPGLGFDLFSYLYNVLSTSECVVINDPSNLARQRKSSVRNKGS